MKRGQAFGSGGKLVDWAGALLAVVPASATGGVVSLADLESYSPSSGIAYTADGSAVWWADALVALAGESLAAHQSNTTRTPNPAGQRGQAHGSAGTLVDWAGAMLADSPGSANALADIPAGDVPRFSPSSGWGDNASPQNWAEAIATLAGQTIVPGSDVSVSPCDGLAITADGRIINWVVALTTLTGSNISIPSITEALHASAFTAPWLAPDSDTGLDQRTGVGTGVRQPGRCLLLNGVNQWVDCGEVTDGVSQLSVTAWIKTTETQGVIAGEYETDGNDRSWSMGLSSGKLRVVLSLNGNYVPSPVMQFQSVASINLGVWAHVAFVFSSGSLTLYIDGQPAPVSVIHAGPIAALHDSSAPLQLGGRSLGVLTLAGLLGISKLFLRAIDPAEVLAIYTQGKTPGSIVPGVPTDAAVTLGFDDNSTTNSLNSGNLSSAANGTIQNGDAGMLYEGSDVPNNRMNLIGYSDGPGGTYVPLLDADPTTDALGNPAQHTGQAPWLMDLFGSPCLTLDGATSYARASYSLSLTGADAFELSATVKSNGPGSNGLAVAITHVPGSPAIIRLGASITGEYVRAYIDDDSGALDADITGTSRIDDGEVRDVKVVHDPIAGEVRLYVDDVLEGSAPSSPSAVFSFNRILLGAKEGASVSNFYAGQVWDVMLSVNGSQVVNAPCNQNSGSTIFNKVTGGSQFTIQNALTTTGTGAWANTQPDFHDAVVNGCTMDGDVLIPANEDSTADANGNPLTNPAVPGINNPYVSGNWNTTPGDPATLNKDIPTNHKLGDPDTANFSVGKRTAVSDGQFTIHE